MNYPFKYFVFYTAQHSDIEPIMHGNFRSATFRMMLYNTKYAKITRYTVYMLYAMLIPCFPRGKPNPGGGGQKYCLISELTFGGVY